MRRAVWPYRAEQVTPMAAVAGAVADELVECYRSEPGVRRAYVNDGGDIALHLAAGESDRGGVFGDLGRLSRSGWKALRHLDGSLTVDWELPVRGVATSGWRGRSFSLGIADSVTVLARDGAAADAAATLIGNAVDLADERIVRRAACELADDTDLGSRLVTVDVPPLGPAAVATALDAGAERARRAVEDGLVWGAVLLLQGDVRVVGGCRSADLAVRASTGWPCAGRGGAPRPAGEVA